MITLEINVYGILSNTGLESIANLMRDTTNNIWTDIMNHECLYCKQIPFDFGYPTNFRIIVKTFQTLITFPNNNLILPPECFDREWSLTEWFYLCTSQYWCHDVLIGGSVLQFGLIYAIHMRMIICAHKFGCIIIIDISAFQF